eukprot:6916653-Pyramimonas_sp.AAC.1
MSTASLDISGGGRERAPVLPSRGAADMFQHGVRCLVSACDGSTPAWRDGVVHRAASRLPWQLGPTR